MNINLADLMKNVQQMQSRMGESREQMARIMVTGSAGGDMVVVVINGLFEVQKVKIDPQMVNPRDVEVLEELVQAAISDALIRVRDKVQEEMSQALGGLPPGFLNGVV